MFWLLLGLAASAFVPAVLGPVWQDRLAWREKELALEAKVAALEARKERNDELIERLKSDPATQRRLAMREIGYVPPGERVVQVLPDEKTLLPDYAKPVKTPPVKAADPSWLEQISGRLPKILAHPAFVTSPSRELLLGMAGVLTIAAFRLYRRR